MTAPDPAALLAGALHADCGEPIVVEDLGEFDGLTGEPRPFWVWHCPDAALDVERLARALRRMVGAGADAIDGPFDVGWLTYGGEATFDGLAADIAREYAGLEAGRG